MVSENKPFKLFLLYFLFVILGLVVIITKNFFTKTLLKLYCTHSCHIKNNK